MGDSGHMGCLDGQVSSLCQSAGDSPERAPHAGAERPRAQFVNPFNHWRLAARDQLAL